MNTTQPRSLRLWPGIALVAVQWLLFWLMPMVAGDAEAFGTPLAVVGIYGGLLGAAAILLWWLLFSRAPWLERVAAIALMVVGVAVAKQVVHESIAGAHMGVSMYIFPIPGLCLALVVWAVATQHIAGVARGAGLVAAVAVALLPWTLIRTAGLMGSGSEYHWRWTPTPEERLLATAQDVPQPLTPVETTPAVRPEAPGIATNASPEKATPAAAQAPLATVDASKDTPGTGEAMVATGHAMPQADWPGFRGPGRDSVIRKILVNTDWSAAPPVEVWRKPIGPGWSSFAVQGDLIYTQEQLGEEELVSCYRLSTGEPVWRHADAVRFWESNGGPGPRGTPTLHDGRVYAFGATGILNALNAFTGKRLWSRNVGTDVNRRVPDWGFTSSPLVIDDVVIVAAAGTLVGYDVATGDLRWQGPRYGGSYSSPHRVTVDGVQQIVLLGGPGAISVAPATGAVLWEHTWQPGAIVQPAVTPDGDILINAIVATGGVGTRRLHVARAANGWNVEERWTSNGLKPYFNDFVVHKGHAYGFDGSILAAIGLEDGARKWKGGRFGNGQLVLLAEQDLLLVISEDGELALVQASPERFTEVARFQALNAKTWNHPVLVRDVLLLRNGEEMAAFRLQTTVHSTER
jgi:outer membrane protein assembly factor BamB